MSYNRVIPRDLFNESSLLKCYARLYILAERVPGLEVLEDFTEEREAFSVQQDEDGALWLGNVMVMIRGRQIRLRRPLNSREPWPLWVDCVGDREIDLLCVFTDKGELSPEFLQLV